jgi:hypothetical protein
LFLVFLLHSPDYYFYQKKQSCYFSNVLIPVSAAHALAAKQLLLPYPRIYVRRLFLRFTGFGGPATAFPHVKFQHKMAYSWGK